MVPAIASTAIQVLRKHAGEPAQHVAWLAGAAQIFADKKGGSMKGGFRHPAGKRKFMRVSNVCHLRPVAYASRVTSIIEERDQCAHAEYKRSLLC
jgi:hypothetical protein